MSKIQFFGVALSIAATFAAFVGACQSTTAPGGVLLMGSWGSNAGRLTATKVNTIWAGSCGSGSTSEPIMLDRAGRFEMDGVYGASGTAQRAARFTGTVSERKLQLRIVIADSSVAFGPIMLDLGQQPALATCH